MIVSMFVRLDLGAELPVLNGLRSVEMLGGNIQLVQFRESKPRTGLKGWFCFLLTPCRKRLLELLCSDFLMNENKKINKKSCVASVGLFFILKPRDSNNKLFLTLSRAFLAMVLSNCLLNICVYTHKLVLLSTLIIEVSFPIAS